MNLWRLIGLRAPAAVLSVVMLGLSVAVPLLDRELPSTGPGVESEHDPGSCVEGHDHTVCSQFGKTRLLPTRSVAVASALPGIRSRGASANPAGPVQARTHLTPSPRAPPIPS